jgi:putative addiction module killer protein
MIEVRRTAAFAGWLTGLRDQNAKGEIASRISRREHGNRGDAKSVAKALAKEL